jgi:hypothetical protein
MVREDRVIMSVKELKRVSVIRQTREKQLTQVKAGALLGLTPHHIRRLIARVAQTGDHGLVHRGRGKPSNRQIPAAVKTKALTLYEKQYGDFGPTLAARRSWPSGMGGWFAPLSYPRVNWPPLKVGCYFSLLWPNCVP